MRLHVGLPRHGKSHAAKRELFTFCREHPAMVLDGAYEWTRAPGNVVPRELADDCVLLRDGDATVARAAALIDSGKRLVVLSTDGDPEVIGEAMCKWARYHKGRAGIVMPEAHAAFPVSRALGAHARACVTAFRHWDVAVWVDTQRFALLNRSWDLAQTIRVFSATDADYKRLREIGGAALVDAVRECGRRNTPKERGGLGEPGWHVTLYEGARPEKYEPERGA